MAAALGAAPVSATTHYFTLAGTTAGVENGCPGWVLADNDDDCSYDNGHPLGTGNAQWIGPVFSAGYYPPGSAPQVFANPPVPAPVTAPGAVLPIGGTTGIPIQSAFLAIDDNGTAGPEDDVVSGTIEFGGFDRNVATSAGTRVVETFGRIIHTLRPVRVTAAQPNAAGGYDYVVAASGDVPGYPPLLSGSTTADGGFSDSFPSQVASQSSLDVSDAKYWDAPGPHGIAVLDGEDYTAGTSSSATVWGYACADGSDAPAAHDCENSFLTWSGDRVANFSNVLLKISTTSTGLISSAEALLVQEAESVFSPVGNDTWVATRLEFTGAETDLPVAFDDRAVQVISPLQFPLTVDVLANDLPGKAPVTVSIVAGPAQGTASVVSNKIQYQRGATPESIQEITYQITDAANHSATAKAQIIITDPVICQDDTATGAVDTPVTVDVLANDSGYDIPPVVLVITKQPQSGSSVVNPDRSITFTPPAGKGGEYVTQYFLADGTNPPATCKLTVKLPGTPQAVDDEAHLLQNGGIVLEVLANDLEVSDTPVTLAVTQAPAHGTASIETVGSVPKIRYTPQAGYAGPDAFKYKVTDVDGDQSNEATVSLDVVGPPNNDLPRCADDEVTAPRNAPTIIDVLANDTGLNALPLTVKLGPLFPEDSATIVVNPDNSVTFTPGTDKGGTFSFAYSASEAVNNPVACTVTVKVNDVPVAKDDKYYGLNFGRVYSLGVLSNDAGLSDAPLTLQVTGAPAHGTLKLCAAASADCPGFTAGQAPYVTYVYDDATGFPASDAFRYRVLDADGEASNEGTVNITVKNALEAGNDPNGFDPGLPDGAYYGYYGWQAFRSSGYAVVSGGSIRLPVMKNDGGLLNGPVTLQIASPPQAGTVTVNADHSITYTAPDGFTGLARMRYSLTDAAGATATADVGVYVFPAQTTDSGGSSLDLATLLVLLGGTVVGRTWRRAPGPG